jgi:alpha-mannosidase
LHQWVYRLGEQDQAIEAVRILPGECGPVFAELVVESKSLDVFVQTRIRLYAELERIEFHNRVRKSRQTRKEQLHFFFPARIPDCQYRYEAPGAIITPGEIDHGGEQLPGSGQAYTAVRHVADMFNDELGICLSQADSGFVLFGHRSEFEDPREPDRASATLISLALGNAVNYAEVTRDQAGQTDFTFRYALLPYGRYDPLRSIRFGWEDNTPLLIHPFTANTDGVLAAGVHSFLEITGQEVVLVNYKQTEALPEEGIIVRLWNPLEQEGQVILHAHLPWKLRNARNTDLLEREKGTLAVKDNSVELSIKGRGLATVLLIFESTL